MKPGDVGAGDLRDRQWVETGKDETLRISAMLFRRARPYPDRDVFLIGRRRRKAVTGRPPGQDVLAHSACATPKGRDYTLTMAQTSNVVYDTHAAVRRLAAAGMPEPHAEAVVREQVHLIEHNLATKADIEKLRQETKADIAAVRADIEKLHLETKTDIETAKLGMIKWTVATNTALAAVVVAVIKFL